MTKKSKVRIAKAESHTPSRPDIEVRIERPPEGKIKCCMCGRLLSTKGSAPSYHRSNSIIYKGNGGFIPVCKTCIEDLYKAYKKALGSEEDAARRICMKFDAYWNDGVFASLKEKRASNAATLKIGDYLKTANLFQYRGNTYDTTIDEEASAIIPNVDFGEFEDYSDIEVTPEQTRIWGAGFDPLFYRELDQKYDYWTEDLDIEKIDKATETLIRQICLQEVILSRDAAAGRPVDKTAKMIDSLLGSLNLKPVQKQAEKTDDSLDEETEKTPFGVWIERIEQDRPIPEPEEQFKDVDKLKEYIQTWFVGGLCNMMRIPNRFSEKFEKAMMRYTVEKPEYEEDDSDASIDDLFEQAEEAGRKMNKEVPDGWECWSSEEDSEANGESKQGTS